MAPTPDYVCLRKDPLVGSVFFRRDLFWRDLLVRSDDRRSMIHFPSTGTTSVPLRKTPRRDVLVTSAVRRPIIHCLSTGTTGVPLRSELFPRDPFVGSATHPAGLNGRGHP